MRPDEPGTPLIASGRVLDGHGRPLVSIPSSQLKRFCDQGWRFADGEIAFLGASSVMIERYRYRGARIPTPWTIDSAAGTG
ncbi:hypothetical protein [Streptomyces sp. V4I2]|jgi:hypothetical protein|uniref:hypothetical protein n=1 Tax=Streptomyces sp. V4I2 TaxID=3042280 RepID=UPI00278474C8|nr:hypothetical protein [Streptomyces sp. V4I2]MDQ1046328.1 hypothetical protein [Streptomyces sp. V4I2]